jgi:hypothetical protein
MRQILVQFYSEKFIYFEEKYTADRVVKCLFQFRLLYRGKSHSFSS